jgi:hypothetical protein
LHALIPGQIDEQINCFRWEDQLPSTDELIAFDSQINWLNERINCFRRAAGPRDSVGDKPALLPQQSLLRRDRHRGGAGITKSRHAIIHIMEVGDVRFYKERWKAVEEIERQELRAMTPEEHWQKLNAIVRFAIETGMQPDNHEDEITIFQRWAKIKAQYEAG